MPRSISLLAFAQLLFFATAATAGSIATVESNFNDYYRAANADTSAPRMSAALSTLESQARSYTAAGYLRSDGSWSDINYAEVPTGTWSPWDHFRRMTVMAKAYTTRGQSLYHDPSLLLSLESALNYVQTFYAADSPQPGNWWFYPIGAPLDLGPTLVLVRNDIRPDILQKSVETLEAHIGPNPYFTPSFSRLKGQNLVWSCFTHLCLAILKNDDALMQSTHDAMASAVTQVRGEDGIQTDNSFQQHGPQLYTGGYGGSFAYEVAKYVLLTRNTTYALPAGNASAFANYMADGVIWALDDNYFDPSTVGREVVRPSTSGWNGVAALVEITAAPTPRAAELQSAAVKMLTTWQWTLPTELAALAVAAETRGGTAAWPAGHRGYVVSDYAIHRRRAWFASVKMLSSRTKSGENTNGENLLGSRQSDGRFHLVLRGDEYYTRNVWAALDWARLPGITVEQKADTADSSYGFGSRSFVGGTDDGRNGVAAMNFAAINSSLTARKSWFFFDDAIVFLTSSISCPTTNPVETIVEQWPLSSGTTPLVVDGVTASTSASWEGSLRGAKWAYADGIGYWFPSGGNIQAKRKVQSGTWSALGGSTDGTSYSAPFLTIWFDHGTAPMGDSDAYAIVPNTDASRMEQWAASNPFTIVANDEHVASVKNNRDGAIGIVFYDPVSSSGITAEDSCVLYKTDSNSRVQLSVADPSQMKSSITLTLAGRFDVVSSDTVVTSSHENHATTLTISVNGGRSSHVQLLRRSHKRLVRR